MSYGSHTCRKNQNQSNVRMFVLLHFTKKKQIEISLKSKEIAGHHQLNKEQVLPVDKKTMGIELRCVNVKYRTIENLRGDTRHHKDIENNDKKECCRRSSLKNC